MTIALRLHSSFPNAWVPDPALGEDARRVWALRTQSDHFPPSITLDGYADRQVAQLFDAYSKAGQPGWDGYDARPADLHAVRHALRFLKCLPISGPAPDIGVDTDGHIVFEWDKDANRIFSVRIGPDSTLWYAGLDGPATSHGKELFLDDLPEAVAIGIDRIAR